MSTLYSWTISKRELERKRHQDDCTHPKPYDFPCHAYRWSCPQVYDQDDDDSICSYYDSERHRHYQKPLRCPVEVCIDFTERADQGKLDPVIGRDENPTCHSSIESSDQNNPFLIGDRGVNNSKYATRKNWTRKSFRQFLNLNISRDAFSLSHHSFLL